MARGFNYAPGASPEADEAMQPGLHRAHLQALSQSKNWLVREVIGAREDCPLGVMVGLAHDSHQEVRMAVAGNPSVARTVMEHLARDRSPEVVIALLGNPTLDMDIVESLAYHKRPDIRGAASARLDAGVDSVRVTADAAIPELRERVAAYDESRVYDFATGRPVELHFEPEAAPAAAPEEPARVAPTRTAPIRGFRIDQVG
jgi:hypothetical protein